jgi:hypothetical protein
LEDLRATTSRSSKLLTENLGHYADAAHSVDLSIDHRTIRTAFGPIMDIANPLVLKKDETNHSTASNTNPGGLNRGQQEQTSNSTPNGGTPNGGTPNGGTPNGGTPNGGTPNGDGTPSSGAPNETSSGGTANSGLPNGIGPNGPNRGDGGSGGRSPNTIREEWEEYPKCPPPTPVSPCDRPETFRNAFFEVKSSILAGFGAFALKNLKWSQTILVEKALFHADRQTLFDELDRLTPSLKQAYYRMHAHPSWSAPSQPKAVSIFTTNRYTAHPVLLRLSSCVSSSVLIYSHESQLQHLAGWVQQEFRLLDRGEV